MGIGAHLENFAMGPSIWLSIIWRLCMWIADLRNKKTGKWQLPSWPKEISFDVPAGMTPAECREYLHGLGIQTAVHSLLNTEGDGLYLTLLVPGRQHQWAVLAINALQQGRPFRGKGNVSSGNPEMAAFRAVGRMIGAKGGRVDRKPTRKHPGLGRRALNWLED